MLIQGCSGSLFQFSSRFSCFYDILLFQREFLLIYFYGGFMMRNKLVEAVLKSEDRVVEIQRRLVSLPALAPENGGKGELAKARYIETLLGAAAVEHTRCDSPDPGAEDGVRPNIIALIPGETTRCLWLFAHMDVVPAGDANAWQGSPWELRRDGDFIYGRGVEDNQQAIASMLALAEALAHTQIRPGLGLGLVFMADEECGSGHGMKWLLKHKAGIFQENDLYIVPDGGSPDGTEIEIAEKGQLWLRFIVNGRQAHASMPQLGNNAFVGASQLVLALQSLYRFFPQRNELFNPPFSTFVPTRHEENVGAVNIVPGRDIFYMDCRLVPELEPEQVLERVRAITEEVGRLLNLGIEIEIIQRQAATATRANAPVVRALEDAIKEVYKARARPTGIGGATVAAFLRERGLAAAVWSCLEGTCHQANEKSSISATLKDAAVFAHILMAPNEGDKR